MVIFLVYLCLFVVNFFAISVVKYSSFCALLDFCFCALYYSLTQDNDKIVANKQKGNNMPIKTLKNLKVKELKDLISTTVREVMEDFLEDIQALSSPKYLNSIKKAREDYKKGKVKSFEEVFRNI